MDVPRHNPHVLVLAVQVAGARVPGCKEPVVVPVLRQLSVRLNIWDTVTKNRISFMPTGAFFAPVDIPILSLTLFQSTEWRA